MNSKRSGKRSATKESSLAADTHKQSSRQGVPSSAGKAVQLSISKSQQPTMAKKLFESVMDEGAQWFTWISNAVKFQNLIRGKIDFELVDAADRKSLENYLNSTPPSYQTMINSFYITMVAGFEEYLRGVIRQIAEDISRSKTSFSEMDEILRRANIRESAKLLRRMDSPPDYLRFDEDDLCRLIGTCTSGSTAVELNALALSEVDGLLKLKNFMERLGLLGKTLSWDDLGAAQQVKDAMKMKAGKPRAVGAAVETELLSIARFRNRIAHTGGHAADVTLTIASEHRALMAAIAAAIDVA
jgi:hypothetical protein